VDRTRLALRVHLVVIAAPLGIQDAMVLQLRLSVATVRLSGHLDQLLHLNATMGQMVAVATELTDLSPMINAIAVPHVLVSLQVSLRLDHGTQVVRRDQTVTNLRSRSVRKPAVTSIGDARHFQLAGLTGMNVRGRNALPSPSVQAHPERQIAGLTHSSASAAGRIHRMHAGLHGAGMVNVVAMVLFCGQR
jgi:hypothetical protein